MPPNENGATATIYDKIKKTVRHTLIFGIGSVVNSAFGLILVPVYSRKLPAGAFGVLSLLTVTLTLVTIVLKFGLNHAFFRHYYETDDSDHRRRIVGSTLVFLFVSCSAATVLLWVLAPQVTAILFKDDRSRANLVQLVFLICFFEVIALVPDSILRAKFKSAQYSTLNITAFVFQLVVIVYLVLGVGANVRNVLIGRLIGAAFEALLFYAMVARDLSLQFSLRELRGLLAFGTPLIFGQVSFHLFMMIDRFFLERFASERDLGAYAMANTLVSVVTILVTVPFSQVWTVMRFSVMNEEGANEYYSRVLTYILFVSMFFALCVSAVAGDGLTLFSLKSYWQAATIIPLLGLAAVLDCASRVLNVGITLKKRTIYAPITIIAALGVNIALNFWLIPRYDIMGATVATLVSYIVFCALRYWASNLFFKVNYEWNRVFTILAVGSALIGGFYLVDSLRGDSPGDARLMLSMAIKASLALSFPLLLLVLRFFESRELHRIVEIWHKLTGTLRRRRLTEPKANEEKKQAVMKAKGEKQAAKKQEMRDGIQPRSVR
ncbi:MAG TPA: oligosaccharide flippase family protein [Blastocatellia bacterium]|nr:oligosaccharide flippase family protein [Blastocatellia bacterium]